MEYFEDYGSSLYLMNQFLQINSRAPKDFSRLHIHPHYELLAALDARKTATIINGNRVQTDYPFILIVSPYNMHFSYYSAFENESPVKINNRLAYFGETFLGAFESETMPFGSLMKDYTACIFDISRHVSEFKKLFDALFFFECGEETAFYSKPAEKMKYANVFRATATQTHLMAAAICRLTEINAQEDIKTVFLNSGNYIIGVIKYISENIEKDLTIPKIAAEFYISKDKLNKDFKGYTSMTVAEFIAYYRLNMAKAFLDNKENKMSVEEIAQLCGFENEIYFYSFFKRHTGVSPRKYKYK